MAATRILIADDHDVVRSGLHAILSGQPGWEVVAEAEDGRQAVALAAETQPDVAIIDYQLPLMNGVDATREIRAFQPSTEVLIFTMHESEPLLRELLEAGARGYLHKSDARKFLIAAVEALSHHKPFFTGSVSETLLNAYLAKGHGADGVLTMRERSVVQLIAEGSQQQGGCPDPWPHPKDDRKPQGLGDAQGQCELHGHTRALRDPQQTRRALRALTERGNLAPVTSGDAPAERQMRKCRMWRASRRLGDPEPPWISAPGHGNTAFRSYSKSTTVQPLAGASSRAILNSNRSTPGPRLGLCREGAAPPWRDPRAPMGGISRRPSRWLRLHLVLHHLSASVLFGPEASTAWVAAGTEAVWKPLGVIGKG